MIDQELYASVGWATLAEPGDELAGFLRLALGSRASLDLVATNAQPRVLLRELESVKLLEAGAMRFGKLEQTLSDGLERYRARFQSTAIENAFKATRIAGAQVIHAGSANWPSALTDLGLAMPAALWIRGQSDALTGSVAIVGSRSITPYGQWVTAEFVGALAQRQVGTISGGAFGVDLAVHKSALAVTAPTIAVMAGGIDRLYPSSNSEILRQITVLAELPPGNRPTRWRFLQRNRLIAALGRATLVVEAGHRSGSINTANHALALGRPLGAVPGPVTSAASIGTNNLIRDGKAQLVANGMQLLALAGFGSEPEVAEEFDLGVLELRVLDALTARFEAIAALAAKANTTTIETAMGLGALELIGRAERDSQDRWRRRVNL